MQERTAKHRQSDTSPAQGPGLNPARHTFPRILTTATMALVLGVLMPGCHGSRTQNAAQSPGGDPSDVNAAETQSSCPNGQVLMSDGSCGAASQAQPQPAAGTQPVQSTPAQTAPAQSYPAQSSAPPPQQDAQYSPPPPQQQYPPDQQQQDQQQPDDQSGGDAGVYDTQNPYDNQTYQQDAYNDAYPQGY